MELFNLEKLVKIEVIEARRSMSFIYQKEKKSFWDGVQKEGVYCRVFSDFIGVDIPDNHHLKEGLIYVNPCVILRFEGKINEVLYFQTYDKALDFVENLKNLTPDHWIGSKEGLQKDIDDAS